MLTGLLNAVTGLLGSLANLLGGLLNGLAEALAPTAAAVPATNDAAPANYEALTEVMDDGAEEAADLLDAAFSGTDALVETSLVDSAHALGDLAEDLAGVTVTTITTNYRPDGSISSVIEEISHAPGAILMMHYVSEVLAPQVGDVGDGVSQFMQQVGTGMGTALDNLTDYDLSYSTSAYGSSLLIIDRS